MSLINEALKKAQRARTAGAPIDQPPVPGGGQIAKRRAAPSANTMVLIGTGAVVLVVLSVVVTVYLVNRPSKTHPAPAISPKPKVATTAVEPPPATVRPAIPAPPAPSTPSPGTATVTPPSSSPTAIPATTGAAPGTSDVGAPSPTAPTVANAAPPTPQVHLLVPAATDPAVAKTPRPAGRGTPPATPAAPPATAAVAPAPTAAPPPGRPVASAAGQVAAQTPAPVVPPPPAQPAATPAGPDERVTAFIESIRISGVRAAGTDSRVLINERVYRVNDVIERTLGIRLVKVTPGIVTFADANGFNYIKQL